MAGVISKGQKKAMRRIMRDMREVKEIESLGIYVHYDPDHAFEAKALIIGPEDTPYEKGFFLFKIQFPDNYPFSSPSVKFMTGDGRTRFHPNLYVKGKVCLSILGTWSGPSWTSSQNISSVLTSIQSLLDDAPLRNEPGFEKAKGEKLELYSRAVQYGVYTTSVMIQLEKCPKGFGKLYSHMKKHFIDNFDWYVYKLNTLSEELDGETERSEVYSSMPKNTFDYRGILNGLLELYNEFTGSGVVTEDTLKFISKEAVTV